MNTQELMAFYRGKRVLITGHTGFKGSWLSRILALAGAEVTGYALDAPEEPSLFRMLSAEKDMDSVTGDVRDLRHLEEVFARTRPEIVLHLAAQPIVRTSYEEPVYTYETNVMGTVHVLECIRHTDSVRSFVNVTTDKVYLNREWPYGYREHERLDGYDPYSNSKSCSELVTASYCRSFFGEGGRACAISTCRAGNVIGGGDFSRDRILPDCVRAVCAGEKIPVRNRYSVRPYQHVLEPLLVYLMIAAEQFAHPELAGSYNVGPREEDCITTGELASLFCGNWGDGACWEDHTVDGPHEAGFLKLDCSKLRQTFHWQPKTTVREAVQMTADWAKAWQAGQDMRAFTDRQILDFAAR